MANRVKVFATANQAQIFATLPTNLDQLVDLSSTQTLTNKTLASGTQAVGSFGGAMWLSLSDTSATAPVSGPLAANIRFNGPLNQVEASYNGAAYVPFGIGSAQFADLQRKFRLLLKVIGTGLGLNEATLVGIGGQPLFNEMLIGMSTV